MWTPSRCTRACRAPGCCWSAFLCLCLCLCSCSYCEFCPETNQRPSFECSLFPGAECGWGTGLDGPQWRGPPLGSPPVWGRMRGEGSGAPAGKSCWSRSRWTGCRCGNFWRIGRGKRNPPEPCTCAPCGKCRGRTRQCTGPRQSQTLGWCRKTSGRGSNRWQKVSSWHRKHRMNHFLLWVATSDRSVVTWNACYLGDKRNIMCSVLLQWRALIS